MVGDFTWALQGILDHLHGRQFLGTELHGGFGVLERERDANLNGT